MLSKTLNTEGVLLASEKRNLLAGQMALLSATFAGIHFIIDVSYTFYKPAAIDALIGCALTGIYIINKKKFYITAKVAGLIFMNLALVLYASIVPKESGVYLYYFPLMAASSVLFGPKEKIMRYGFSALSFALLLLLFITDFRILGDVASQASINTNLFFNINSITSGVIMIICIDFMLKLNEVSENQLQRLAGEIKAKNDDLEKTNTELDRFLYSTSHDLRSPLSSIKGLINVARYDTSDPKIHRYFNMMIDRVNRLENFIKEIIDYSKNERTDLRPEMVDFNELVAEVADNLKYVEGADAIEFKNEIVIDHPVLTDKGRLSIVLTNLIANAIKYHDLRKENRWISVRVSNSNGTVKLMVSDNGTGISEDHQQRIFEMFYRGTLQSNGSGLGLYIVKETIEKMQGTITVESRVGEGASFLVTLPVSRPGTAHRPAAQWT